jgi:hypothetical protein
MGAPHRADKEPTLHDPKQHCTYLRNTKQVSAILTTFLQSRAENKAIVILSYLKSIDKFMNYLKILGDLVN